MKVAFQGEVGAYSEEATLGYFKEEIETIGYPTSEQVFEALIKKEVALAVLPVENSIVGNVSVNLDLLFSEPVFAVGETYHPIHHHLMGLPGSNIKEIKKVISHPIALAQCRNFLLKQGIQAVAEYDTAGACKILSKSQDRTTAAIGSKLCANAYGLEVLADNIQKAELNITRFLVLSREDEIPEGMIQTKTSIAFSAHHHPGALLDCLQIFKKFEINLTKLESRPIVTNPFEYYFFVDFQNGLKEKKTIDCLSELNKGAHHVKVLGSYPEGRKPHL